MLKKNSHLFYFKFNLCKVQELSICWREEVGLGSRAIWGNILNGIIQISIAITNCVSERSGKSIPTMKIKTGLLILALLFEDVIRIISTLKKLKHINQRRAENS